MGIPILDFLNDARRSATGSALAAITSVLSLPQAAGSAVVASVQGKSGSEAALAVMEKYREFGYELGYDQADEIARQALHAWERSKKHP
jgi:hypothetical protein